MLFNFPNVGSTMPNRFGHFHFAETDGFLHRIRLDGRDKNTHTHTHANDLLGSSVEIPSADGTKTPDPKPYENNINE